MTPWLLMSEDCSRAGTCAAEYSESDSRGSRISWWGWQSDAPMLRWGNPTKENNLGVIPSEK